MLKVRSRSGVVGVTAGAAALLALPVVAAGQAPVVDQVVGGVTQTAQSLAPAPPAGLPAPTVKPAPPAGLPAPPAPAGSGAPAAAPAPPASAPSGAPRQVTATGSAGSERVASSAGKAHARKRGSSDRKGSGAKATGAQSGATASQSEGSGAQGGGSQADDSGATDVEIAAGESGDESGAASLPFTGFGLVLLTMLGLGALAGGAVLRRAA